MLAIHNSIILPLKYKYVANAFAKLSKCQQFTTIKDVAITLQELQTLLQSYQNVSNSQHYLCNTNNQKSCKRFCKVIKMLAIHNQQNIYMFCFFVANAFAKLSKCQQFTTRLKYFLNFLLLQTLLQSYQNVSNSQPSTLSAKT